tara:strand:- start:247 stop:495 length:249 start_codon:yes stop_codon:yes gene_type:complete
MQKIINGIAIFSGAVALSIVGIGGYVFVRKDAIIDNIKSKVMESVLPSGIGGALTDGAFPSLPSADAPTQSAPDAGFDIPKF